MYLTGPSAHGPTTTSGDQKNKNYKETKKQRSQTLDK